MARLEVNPDRREAGNRRQMASPGLQALLALEIASW